MAKRPNKLSGSPHSSDNESEPPSSEGRRSPSPTQESAEFRTPARGRPGPGSGRSVRFGAGAGKSGPSQPPRVGLGKGAGKGPARVRRIARDSIQGITKASIRRMARRGGVKRISATIYEDIRRIIHERLTRLLQMSITVACLRANVVKNDLSVVDKTVTIMLPDVSFTILLFYSFYVAMLTHCQSFLFYTGHLLVAIRKFCPGSLQYPISISSTHQSNTSSFTVQFGTPVYGFDDLKPKKRRS